MNREAGLSLVELMIALLLGVLLISGAGHLFLSTNKTYTLQDQLIRIQENARTALEQLVQDVRMSAYTGCSASVSLGNALYTADEGRLWIAHFDKGILGLPAGSVVKKAIDSYALSEALVVHRVDWENSLTVLRQSTDTTTLSLSMTHDFNQGDVLALVGQDCKQVSVFVAGSDTKGATVSYPAAGSRLLSNCTTLFKGNFNCLSSQKGASSFDHTGSQLASVSSIAYYIRESNGVPTLYRKRGGETSSGRKLSAEALVEGIENLRVRYGYDSDDDGVVNQYLSPADIAAYSHDWKSIVSVKLELLVRSLREMAIEPQPYFFSGIQVTPEDTYIRRTLVATIGIRNRGY